LRWAAWLAKSIGQEDGLVAQVALQGIEHRLRDIRGEEEIEAFIMGLPSEVSIGFTSKKMRFPKGVVRAKSNSQWPVQT
jgi:hypothetical protein